MDPADWLAIGLLIAIVILMIQATIILKLSDFVNDVKALAALHGPRPDRIEILFQENTMASVVEGKTVSFTVQGFKKDRPVPLKDAASVVTADPAIAMATVNTDGTGGVLTGVAANADGTDASTTLNATSGSLTATDTVTVTADNTPDSIKIVFGT